MWTVSFLVLVGSGSGWIRNFCLDPDLELRKFKDGSGSGINHSGSTTLNFFYLLEFRRKSLVLSLNWNLNGTVSRDSRFVVRKLLLGPLWTGFVDSKLSKLDLCISGIAMIVHVCTFYWQTIPLKATRGHEKKTYRTRTCQYLFEIETISENSSFRIWKVKNLVICPFINWFCFIFNLPVLHYYKLFC